MRFFLILTILFSNITLGYAEDRGRQLSPDSERVPTHSPERTPIHSPERINITAPIRATVNKQKSTRQDGQVREAVFNDMTERCVRPEDIISFRGQHLSVLSERDLALKLSNDFVALKRLSISDNQIINQLPKDNRLVANHIYPISLAAKKGGQAYQQTNLTIRICSFSKVSHTDNAVTDNEPGEILILVDTLTANALKQKVIKLGHSVIQYQLLKGLDKVLVTIDVEGDLIDKVLNDLRASFPKSVIDLNHRYQATASPRTYAAGMIAWPDIKTCVKDKYKALSIGMIDGYVDQTHPALAKQNITIKSFIKETDEADEQHGTAIATLLTGDRGDVGFEGLLPSIRIMAASVLRKERNGLIATTEGIVRSVDWLIIKNVRLINVSLSGTKFNLVMKSVVDLAIKKGLIIFSAAGNGGKKASESYPAALPGVIAVTAIDAAKEAYTEANQGKYIDFSAPGVDIWVVDRGVQGKYSSGTSYAVPYALASAASYLIKNPSLSRAVLYKAMQENSIDLGVLGHDSVYGWGLVQVRRDLCQRSGDNH
jgi:hypothetical protein